MDTKRFIKILKLIMEEKQKMPESKKELLSFNNPEFLGGVRSSVGVRPMPEPSIYVSQPYGWQINYEVRKGSVQGLLYPQSNVEPSILNIPGKPGWKFEPADSMPYVEFRNRQNVVLKKGWYRFWMRAGTNNIMPSQKENFAWGVYFRANGELHNHLMPLDKGGTPRFNAKDHAKSEEEVMSFLFYVERDFLVDEIGVSFSTTWNVSGSFLEIYYINLEYVEDAQPFEYTVVIPFKKETPVEESPEEVNSGKQEILELIINARTVLDSIEEKVRGL